ncbi:unnamed protein product, partial [Dicrocoelium dendriticum]
MKLQWPTPFAGGDVESWLEEFEAIATCNGIKGDANLLTALGTLLTGRAKATYQLTRKAKAGCLFAEMKAALCAEFGKESDRQHALEQFHSTNWEEQEDLVVFFQRLKRHLEVALPELDGGARDRLLRGQFVRSLPKPIQDKVKLASMVGVSTAEDLVAVAQSFVGPVEMGRIEPSALECKIDQLSRMVERLVTATSRTETQRNAPGRRSRPRCFRCNQLGHYAAYCTKRNFYRCFSLSMSGRWRVPSLEITIEGVIVNAIIDTGAGASITKRFECVPLLQSSIAMQTVGGHCLKVTGTQRLRVRIGKTVISHSMFVVEGATETIIGNDILKRLGATIDLRKNVLVVDSEAIEMSPGKRDHIGAVTILPECPNRAIRDVLQKYSHLFTDVNDDYGFCSWVEHRIPLVPGGQCKPIFRRIPQNTLGEIQKQVAEMEARGIIRRTNSPYSSPVLLTRKADGSYRFCIDFRELNRVTVKDAFPMPQMEEIFSNLHNAKLISLIDLRSGYWQLPIAEEDRYKTAFSVNGQQYEFLRMPFGLCNAPATFRRLLLMVLENLKNVVVYGDDIVIFSETEEDHGALLAAVLQRLEEAGLKLSRKKSQIAQKSIVCLGHIVGNGQVQPLPEKRESIKNFAAPKSKRQLRSFLGIATYDSRFVPHFAERISPLLKLLRKNESFTWTPEADRAFNELKQYVADAPACLRLPNPGEKFTVAVDASNVAIGAVLSQPAGVVEYASRVLTSAEQKYSTTEKECLAIVWALEKWRTYLLATEFHVVTDHKPLSWLMTTRDPRGRLARWAYRLQEFTFTIEHIDGTKNVMPDMLSRPSLDEFLPDTAIPVSRVAAEDRSLLESQRANELVRLVCTHLQAGTKPEVTSGEIEELLRIWDKLEVANGNLLGTINGMKVLFIPQNLRERVLQVTHDDAHIGFERVLDLLQRRVFWPTMRKDVAAYIRGCPSCQTNRDMDTARPPMRSIEVNQPFQFWGLDVFGPLPVSRSGNRYILVMIDHFTRWIEAIPIKDQTGETVAQVFESNIPARYGVPQCVLTDQGPCFESRAFQAVLQKWNIQRRRTSPYHPQTNGLTERFNRTMKTWINCTKLPWEQALPRVLLAYRTSKQSTTKVAPFELLFGRQPRIPLDACITQTQGWDIPPTHRARLEATARREIKFRQARNKRNYDARYATHKWQPYSAGANVAIRNHARPEFGGPGTRKFREYWRGPYTVLHSKGENVKVHDGASPRWMNAAMLRPWHVREHQLREGAGVGRRKAAFAQRTVRPVKRRPTNRETDAMGAIRWRNPGPIARDGNGTGAASVGEPEADKAGGEFVEDAINRTKPPVSHLQETIPGRVIHPRSSKAHAIERLRPCQNRRCGNEDTRAKRIQKMRSRTPEG